MHHRHPALALLLLLFFKETEAPVCHTAAHRLIQGHRPSSWWQLLSFTPSPSTLGQGKFWNQNSLVISLLGTHQLPSVR